MSSNAKKQSHANKRHPDWLESLEQEYESFQAGEPQKKKMGVCVNFHGHEICRDTVDAVADEFIRLEHLKFELGKLQSMKSGKQ